MARFDAIVLAGGLARRLGGADKAALLVDGTPLLDRAIAAVRGAGRVVVVGPVRRTSTQVTWTREAPTGGGPVAAIAAGLPLVSAPVTVVLACDLPAIDARTVGELAASLTTEAAVPVDDSGHRQPLAAAYDTAALRTAVDRLTEGAAGVSMRALLAGMMVQELRLPAAALRDIDTWDDLAETGTPPSTEER